MQDRLFKDFTLKRSGEKWLVAWALEKAAQTGETKKTEPPKVEEKKAEEKK